MMYRGVVIDKGGLIVARQVCGRYWACCRSNSMLYRDDVATLFGM